MDSVAQECPLEIAVNGEHLVTLMRTPGDDLNLVAGFLYSSGIIESAEDIENLRCFPGEESRNAFPWDFKDESSKAYSFPFDVTKIEVSLQKIQNGSFLRKPEFSFNEEFVSRVKKLIGLRRKEGIEKPAGVFDSSMIFELGEVLTRKQSIFCLTGGTHAAGVFDTAGRVIKVCEDVGRHNAVDKALGSCLRSGIDLSGKGLILSGRASFEMVLKSAVSGLSILCSVSAPTSLGVRLARELGLTLVGFLRVGRFNIYAHEWRIC